MGNVNFLSVRVCNVTKYSEWLTFIAADRVQSSSTWWPVRMVTMPAVSSSPLLWETVSWRQLSTILYKCLGIRKKSDQSFSSNEHVRKQIEVTMKGQQGLPGFYVLPFQFISFKTSTRLLLAAYVPTEGCDKERLEHLRNPPQSSVTTLLLRTPTCCLCEIQTPESGCHPSHQHFPSSVCQVHQSLQHRSSLD